MLDALRVIGALGVLFLIAVAIAVVSALIDAVFAWIRGEEW